MTPRAPDAGYPFLEFRRGVWREIARYVRRDAPEVGTLLELGAGYCDFINQFPARQRIGIERDPAMRRFAAAGVDLRIASAADLPDVATGSVDLVFASNFLEHLTAEAHDRLLPEIARVLAPAGQLILLQPNHRRCAEHYWDDPTHRTVFSDVNITPFLARHGFGVVKLIPGLLPFSMKSRLPKWPLLVRLYLWSPFKPLGAQMYVVARKEARHLER